jgi:hypothetical protein
MCISKDDNTGLMMIKTVTGFLGLLFLAVAAHADTIELPSGWTTTSTNAGITEIRIAGSEDVVIAGLVGLADTAKVVNAIAAQTTAAFKVTGPFPLKRESDGTVYSGGTLQFKDGRLGMKFIAAAPVRSGGTAFTAIVTPNRADQAALLKKTELMGQILGKLKQGDTLPGVTQTTARAPEPKVSDSRVSAPKVSDPKVSGRNALPPVAPVKTAPGMAGIAGLWIGVDMTMGYTMSGMQMVSDNIILLFGRDGSFTTFVPDGRLDAAAIRSQARTDPERAGMATVVGNKILLRYASGKTETILVERTRGVVDGLRQRGRILNPKYIAASGLKLSGSYTGTNLTQIGMSGMDTTSFVGSSTDILFAPDGRFTFDRSLYMDTPGVVGRDTDSTRSGRYEVREGSLILTFKNGGQKVYSFWYEDPKLDAIWLDDSMYKK